MTLTHDGIARRDARCRWVGAPVASMLVLGFDFFDMTILNLTSSPA
ncbi:hypothetical protein [Streptomyces rhizosphaerihabitans]|nr:hypothetical protein [Streptomyces rhizosphaerihabitans]MCT9003768.1 hypothetical protein [Streptomyces rhizosphaerihabitans]